MNMDFTHLNEEGRARMVDITQKNDTNRVAVAQGKIRMQPATLQAIQNGVIKKGAVLAVAQVAGIIALLTIYDMCKAVDRWMEIVEIKLLEKNGGKSGHVLRGENA